jgi:hypothetical protein
LKEESDACGFPCRSLTENVDFKLGSSCFFLTFDSSESLPLQEHAFQASLCSFVIVTAEKERKIRCLPVDSGIRSSESMVSSLSLSLSLAWKKSAESRKAGKNQEDRETAKILEVNHSQEEGLKKEEKCSRLS